MTTQRLERREHPRLDFHGRVEINSAQSPAHLRADGVNVSEEGLCLRLQEALEVRSVVKLKVFPEARKRPFECAGRVAWVVQRLDLRPGPPFLFDVGIEFVDPPAALRQFLARYGGTLTASPQRLLRNVQLEPATIRGRRYLPRLDREGLSPARWHLVVFVDDVPCFSARFPSEREAVEAWTAFQRQQARRPTTEVPR